MEPEVTFYTDPRGQRYQIILSGECPRFNVEIFLWLGQWNSLVREHFPRKARAEAFIRGWLMPSDNLFNRITLEEEFWARTS